MRNPIPAATAALLLTAMSTSVRAQTIYFVKSDAPPGGNGLAWETAFAHPQQALDASPGGPVEVWIAAATYLPLRRTDPTDPRTAGFGMQNGYALYGGFAGHEVSRSQRDPAANPTILSGDLGEPNDPADNAFHVLRSFRSDRSAILDGFTVRDGSCNLPEDRGAGLYAQSSSMVIRNCIFEHNYAHWEGAAIYAFGGFGGLTLIDVVVRDNVAENFGGAVRIEGSPTLLARCTFTGNQGQFGGGLSLGAGAHRVIDCSFLDNHAVGGGAITIERASRVELIGCRMERNTAQGGGGAVLISEGRQVIVDRCIFVDNAALNGDGGGLYFRSNEPVWIRSSFFARNSSTGYGGAMYARPRGGGVFGCVITENSARWGGGVATNPDGQTCHVIASTIHGNLASQSGGGVFIAGIPLESQIHNSIVWGNEDPTGHGEDAQVGIQNGPPIVHRSCIQGWSGSWPGVGNIGADPRLVDPLGGDLRIGPGSPCIDAADNRLIPPDGVLDFAAQSRFVDDPLTPDTGFGIAPIVDMGAYEFQDGARSFMLAVTGRCPPGGAVLISWAGARPRAHVAVLYASTTGNLVIPNGYLCAGTPLGLSSTRLNLVLDASSDDEGKRTIPAIIARNACGGWMQAIDLRNCRTSNVVQLN